MAVGGQGRHQVLRGSLHVAARGLSLQRQLVLQLSHAPLQEPLLLQRLLRDLRSHLDVVRARRSLRTRRLLLLRARQLLALKLHDAAAQHLGA